MEIIDVLTFIASIVSIGSGGGSVVMFLKNKTIRNDIIKKNIIVEYSDFCSTTYKTVENIKKFSGVNDAGVKSSVKTLSFSKLLKELTNYYEKTKFIETDLINDGYKNIDDDLLVIKDKINFFKQVGKSAYKNSTDELTETCFHVIEMQDKIKKMLQAKIYK
ncbi:hypothetical protein [Treponema endosymbiont of Eucomonympha sp.]|uniref:hypothetical protein n=1 Tax=Treponema endosymbiont of Eucomonympha sp. TaxID=1580831 RepID=UPI0007820EA8|nr:hypothetical protein [Treponema endosymbiont of Eucomonympha sp.]